VVVNGEQQPCPPGASVRALVAALGRSERGVAVAVNGEVVPRSEWGSRALHDDDRVEVLTAAQGG
jgi:sulfur carrier protein